MKRIHGIDDGELKKSIARLSHFAPSSQDDYGHQVIDYIVLDAMADIGCAPVSVKDLKTRIKKNVFLDFEEDEIVESGKRLSTKGLISSIEMEARFQKPMFQLNEKTEQDLCDNRIEISNLETDVLEEWKRYLSDKYEGVEGIDKSLNRIVLVLQNFIAKMFVKHGVETISLLYPDKDKTKKWLKENGFDILREINVAGNELLKNLVMAEVPLFFQKSNEKRGRYLSNLFNSSFYWHLVQVDDKCSNLLKESTKDQKLFLDNNILYSLIGLHGEDAMESSHTMLKYAKNLGYVLLVTTKTIDEFQNTLNWQLKEHLKKKTISVDLARLALDQLGETSFITVFWRSLVDKGVSLREFVAESSYLEDVLEGLEIIVNNKFRKDIDESEELKDEMSELRKVCREDINLNIVEHDAFHRILIRKYRKGNKYNFNSAKAWFLTHDHKLLSYSRNARKGETYLPFCITTNEWIQINRPLLTRTVDEKEFEKSFMTLVTQPSIRAMISTEPLERSFNRILSRLDRFKSMDAQTASRIISDLHFKCSLVGDETDEELDIKIESQILSLNRELRQKHEALILEKKGEEKKVEKLQQKMEALAAEISQNKGDLDRTNDNFQKALDGYGNKVKDLRGAIAGKDGELDQKDAEISSLREDSFVTPKVANGLRRWKTLGYLSLIPLFIIACAFFFALFFTEWKYNPINGLIQAIDQEQGVRGEIYKWVTILILGSGLVFFGKICLNRLLSEEKKSVKEVDLKKKYTEEFHSSNK